MWQDAFLGAIQWVMVLLLLPTLISKTEKPTLISSICIGLCLLGIAVAYFTLGLRIGALPAFIQGLMWFVLGYQRYRINKKRGLPLFSFWQ